MCCNNFNNCGCNQGGCCQNGCNRTPIYLRVRPTPTPTTPTTFNQNATVFNGATVTLTAGTPIPFPSTLTNNGLTTTGTGITVPNAGTYLVGYTTGSADVVGDDSIGIAVNGAVVNATTRLLNTTGGVSGNYILNLNAGDTITLVPNGTTATTLTPTNTLTVERVY